MKNLKIYFTVIALACSLFSFNLKADTATNFKSADSTSTAQIRSEVLLNRLENIKNMDKSDMNRAEKKELRKEVRAAKKELKDSNGGVYISVGAILLIALLLILLL